MERDDLFKREEDRKWRERVDERLAALTSGETVQDDRLDQLEEAHGEIDKALRGDPGGGLIEQINEIAGQVRRTNAVLWPDAVGNGGLISSVNKLLKKDEREAKTSDNRWKFATAVLAVAISSGLIGRYLEKIEVFVKTVAGVESSVPARAKAPKHGRRHLRAQEHDEQDSVNE